MKYLLKLIPLCLLLPLFFENTCLCFYNSEIGYYNKELGFNINTQFTRQYFQLKKECIDDVPCHVYATVPEDMAHAAFINVHTSKNIQQVLIKYSTLESYNK
jgi:hypothetical protein